MSQSRERAGRIFFVFLVIVAVIVAGLFGVDRWAHNRAERTLEDKITSTDSASFSNLDTSIDGFPFLTQVLNDNLEHIQITADALTSSATGSEPVTIENLDVNLRGVNPNAPYQTQSLYASGSLPFEVVERIVHDFGFEGVAVSASDSGALAFTVEAFGYPVTASALIKVSESGRGFIFNIEDADLGIFSFDLGSILPTSSTEIEIQQLPEGVRITDALVVGNGVELTVQGNDLALEDLAL